MPEVKTDLMKSSCFWPAFDEAVSRRLIRSNWMRQFNFGKGSVVGPRLFWGWIVGRRQGFFHQTFVVRPPADHCPIALLGAALDKFKFQRIECLARCGKEHNATCWFVQPVHWLQPSVPFPCFVEEVAQVVRFMKINVRPVHQQTVGFGSRQNAAIVADHIEVRFCTNRRGRCDV